MHLIDITYQLHEVGFGFDLVFRFEKNDYFTNEELKKTFVMTKQNVIEKCEGSVVTWKDGKDITKKKVKKKKGKKPVTKVVDCESFFNFFKTITLDSETIQKV
jgi:nucleosome assembly protein 1-like 1